MRWDGLQRKCGQRLGLTSLDESHSANGDSFPCTIVYVFIMRLEAIESGPAEDAIEGVRKEQVKLDTLHSVTGVVWHHITCL